jgi:hypothetical protein
LAFVSCNLDDGSAMDIDEFDGDNAANGFGNIDEFDGDKYANRFGSVS